MAPKTSDQIYDELLSLQLGPGYRPLWPPQRAGPIRQSDADWTPRQCSGPGGRVVFDPKKSRVKLGDLATIKPDGQIVPLFSLIERDQDVANHLASGDVLEPPLWKANVDTKFKTAVDGARSRTRRSTIIGGLKLRTDVDVKAFSEILWGNSESKWSISFKASFSKSEAAYLSLASDEYEYDTLSETNQSETWFYLVENLRKIVKLYGNTFAGQNPARCIFVTSVDLCYGLCNGVLRQDNFDVGFRFNLPFLPRANVAFQAEHLNNGDCRKFEPNLIEETQEPAEWEYIYAFRGEYHQVFRRLSGDKWQADVGWRMYTGQRVLEYSS